MYSKGTREKKGRCGREKARKRPEGDIDLDRAENGRTSLRPKVDTPFEALYANYYVRLCSIFVFSDTLKHKGQC